MGPQHIVLEDPGMPLQLARELGEFISYLGNGKGGVRVMEPGGRRGWDMGGMMLGRNSS